MYRNKQHFQAKEISHVIFMSVLLAANKLNYKDFPMHVPFFRAKLLQGKFIPNTTQFWKRVIITSVRCDEKVEGLKTFSAIENVASRSEFDTLLNNLKRWEEVYLFTLHPVYMNLYGVKYHSVASIILHPYSYTLWGLLIIVFEMNGKVQFRIALLKFLILLIKSIALSIMTFFSGHTL